MAGAGAGGAGMAMAPGMAFGGNAMATPATFTIPPGGHGGAGHNHGGPGDSCCGGGGGGAYDLRALEREEEPTEDLHACLGVDVGTSSIKVGHPDSLVRSCCVSKRIDLARITVRCVSRPC